MRTSVRRSSIVLLASASLVTACGRKSDTSQVNTVPPATVPVAAQAPAMGVPDTTFHHHSKLAGAAAGAAAGHMLGGHAVLGAAAGALIQHHRNKEERKALAH